MFAVLFFLMLFVLGIGSTVGMGSCILRIVRDQFGQRAGPSWALAGGLATLGFAVSIVYMTPGGQFILNLVDFYGVSFTALILAIGELLAVAWFYGGYSDRQHRQRLLIPYLPSLSLSLSPSSL